MQENQENIDNSDNSPLDGEVLETPKKRGPKPGQRHKGMFVKGQSGNPGGVSRVKRMSRKKMEEIAQEYGPAIMEDIAKLALDAGQPNRDRLDSAALVLAYGYGKPVDRQVAQQMGDSSHTDIQSLSRAQLAEAATQVLEKAGALPTPPSDLNSMGVSDT